MKIVGMEGLDAQQVAEELQRGARFVFYQYCISLLVVTFKRSSDIYFVRAGESAVGKGLTFSVISFLLGWWGIPWGPIFTVGTLATNFGGGKDVTREVLASFSQRSA
jgi:hypothetical protein